MSKDPLLMCISRAHSSTGGCTIQLAAHHARILCQLVVTQYVLSGK